MYSVLAERPVTERYIASAVGVSQERVHSILTEDLAMRNEIALGPLGTRTSDN